MRKLDEIMRKEDFRGHDKVKTDANRSKYDAGPSSGTFDNWTGRICEDRKRDEADRHARPRPRKDF